MKNLVEGVLENLSTKEVFLFRALCATCGRQYGNRAMRFSKADITKGADTTHILYQAVYEQEFRLARQSAIQIAAENLNCCPICKRLVCNRCFWICDDLDMCRQCATALGQSGSPVLADARTMQS